MHKVLITGITGFLGAHIAEKLVNLNVPVIGLRRPSSDIWRCEDFKDKIDWVDMTDDYCSKLIKLQPDVLIHSAWIGVGAAARESFKLQAENIDFFVDMLEMAKQTRIKKILFLGSQSEYGLVNEKVSETKYPQANSAYGAVKLACLELLKAFSALNQIEWVWLRVFSIFGEKEGDNWLIPSLVNKMLIEDQMDLTPGEQRYAYMYVKDFADTVCKIINMPVPSGVYNISSDVTVTLKALIVKIRDIVNPKFRLNFGAIAYRDNQSMHIEGDTQKLNSIIGKRIKTDFNVALQQTLMSYLNQS
jgi:UDP-glucose 4-epimerase